MGAVSSPVSDKRRPDGPRSLKQAPPGHNQRHARPLSGLSVHRAWYTTDGSMFVALAERETREGTSAFFEEWNIADEPGEVAFRLQGDVGLVPLA